MLSKRKVISLSLLLVLLVSAAGLILVYRKLPGIIEYYARQIIVEKTPFSSFKAYVLQAGLSGMEIDGITVGDAQNYALSIGSVRIRYSPLGLFRKRITSITIHDLNLFLNLRDGELTMPGLATSDLKKKEQPGPAGLNIPMDLGKLQVKNGILHLTVDGKQLVIPFDLVFKQENAGQQPNYKAVMQLLPRAEKVTLAADIDLAANAGQVKLAAESLQLGKFADLFSAGSEIKVNGLATVSAVTDIKLQPFEIISAGGDIGLQPFHLKTKDIQIGAQADASSDKPLHIAVAYKEKKLQYRLDSIFLYEPIRGTADIGGILDLTDRKMSGSGAFSIAVLQLPPLDMAAPLTFIGDSVYEYDRLSRHWYFDIKQGPAAVQQSIGVQYQYALVESGPHDFAVSGRGVGRSGKISFSATYPEITVRQNDMEGKAGLVLTGDAMVQSGMETAGEKIQAAGLLEIVRGSFQHRNSGITVQEVNGTIPWQWPAAKQAKTGSISAAKMKWRKSDLGTLSSNITLLESNYSLQGKYTSSLLQGFILNFSGRADMAAKGLAAELKMDTDTASFTSVNLGKVDPSLAETFLNGKFTLDGSLKYDNNGVQGTMQADLQDGRLEFRKTKYVVEGLAVSVQLPMLPQIRSGPAQQIRFSSASLGNFSLTGGKAAWQLESMDSLFIESSYIRWAGGTLQVTDVRLAPAKDRQFITITCERLNIIEVLKQFGIENAEGEGTVSGKIPLLLGKKNIAFNDGQLASSPGEGGRIRVAAMDVLAAGIPKNTPQFAQVDFAAEALKNFQYNWVKFFLNTEGEDLVVQMQMDGKPVQSLPFTYDSQTGLLQRKKDGGPGINQPIRLDVNFRLPLNRFLGYSGKIQDIMKKIK